MKTRSKNQPFPEIGTGQPPIRPGPDAAPNMIKPPARTRRRPSLRLAALFAFLCAAGSANSQPLHLNFDSINAGGGVDATAYLASFGIILTNVSNPGSVYIVNDTNFYGSGVVTASSRHNFLLQSVG